MELIKLNLKNFKGLKSLELNPGGKNIDIFGDNATGKTTIADAFNWLLFGKDSQDKKDFEIKTLDENNKVIHGLEHEVEGVLEVEGKELILKKIYKEKWTKSKGMAQTEFTGHTTDHFIDEVPVKKSEYDAKVTEIADENIFKLLTSPIYFNENIHWQDRRNILIEICGDVSNEDIISSNAELKNLAKILKERTIDEHKKIITSKKTKLNKELEKIPTRIDEVSLNLPDVKGINAAVLVVEKDKLEKDKEMKMQELSRIIEGGEIAEKTKKIRVIESELIDLKNKHQTKINELIGDKQKELRDLNGSIETLEGSIERLISDQKYRLKDIESLNNKNKVLRDNWTEINDRQLDHKEECICPTCGQDLPADKLKEAREKALSLFNENKAQQLASISEKGKYNKEKIQGLQKEVSEIKKNIEELKEELKNKTEKRDVLIAEVNKLGDNVTDINEDSEYIASITEKESLETEIVGLQKDKSSVIEKIKTEISKLDKEEVRIEEQSTFLKQHEQGQERVKELKEDERKLASEFEELEHDLYLIEQFTIAKVDLLEEKINQKFKMAKFKLFNKLINGGVEEACETLYQGVPYSSLNNAARVNVGLDIINTLVEHYGFNAPIFIDNREAVTELINAKGQVISLIVSDKDKELRIQEGDE